MFNMGSHKEQFPQPGDGPQQYHPAVGGAPSSEGEVSMDASGGLGGSLQDASAASRAEMSAAIKKGTCPVEPCEEYFEKVVEEVHANGVHEHTTNKKTNM